MKRKDFIIIGTLLIVFSLIFVWVTFLNTSSGKLAKVYQGSQVVIEVDFETKQVKTYKQKDFEDYPKLTTPVAGEGGDVAYIIMGSYEIDGIRTEAFIEIDWDTNSIRIERDSTPKQIGVTRGWYNGQGLPVVSLPNQIYIRFEELIDTGLDGAV